MRRGRAGAAAVAAAALLVLAGVAGAVPAAAAQSAPLPVPRPSAAGTPSGEQSGAQSGARAALPVEIEAAVRAAAAAAGADDGGAGAALGPVARPAAEAAAGAPAGGEDGAGPLVSPAPAAARRAALPGRPAVRTEGARKGRAAETVALARKAPAAVPAIQRGERPADLHPCADPRLVGVHVPAVLSDNKACGIADPVRVNALGGVRLSTAATLDCETARRTALFLQTVVSPLARRVLGSPVEEAWVMGSYVCRTRNHKPGGRISEHGKGRAIDFGGFTLADGRKITITDHWGRGDPGIFLRQVHRQACGLFKTVLGPGSDAYHDDHLHLDTARRSGAPYCR